MKEMDECIPLESENISFKKQITDKLKNLIDFKFFSFCVMHYTPYKI